MTFRSTESVSVLFAVRMATALIGVGLAGWLLWLSASAHLARACVLMDTPYLPLCPEKQTDADRQRKLRAYLAINPGDSGAWIQLTNLETGTHEKALFRAATTLAPAEPNVLMWRAGEALANNQPPQAVDLLVQLVVYRGREEASQALARIVASGEGTVLLRPHVATAERWLPRLLVSMATLKLPLGAALPLVTSASAQGAVPKSVIQSYIRSLQVEGNWSDAYGLWVAQHKGPTPLLHNGSFDQPFEPDGFDWLVTPVLPSRGGALVGQRAAANRGQILEIEFSGRPVAVPILRQYVFAAPGKYLLRGRYMSARLRMEQGLAWTVRCINARSPGALAGRSEGLQDTAGKWHNFQFSVDIPRDCGLVASVQLETFAPVEASTGFKGRASFDALGLTSDRM